MTLVVSDLTAPAFATSFKDGAFINADASRLGPGIEITVDAPDNTTSSSYTFTITDESGDFVEGNGTIVGSVTETPAPPLTAGFTDTDNLTLAVTVYDVAGNPFTASAYSVLGMV